MMRSLVQCSLILTLAAMVAGFDAVLPRPVAVETFHSVGIYWSLEDHATGDPCTLEYRRAGAVDWLPGLAPWYDPVRHEYRGSLVELVPGSPYEVRLTTTVQTDGGRQLASTTLGDVQTWSEVFPIGTVHYLDPISSTTLTIQDGDGGDENGYTLYTHAPGQEAVIDVEHGPLYDIVVKDSFVIIRGLHLRNARKDAVFIDDSANDLTSIVIEDCDISGWGSETGLVDNPFGQNYHAAVASRWHNSGGDVVNSPTRVIIQRNLIHHPATDSNSWNEYNSDPDVNDCGSDPPRECCDDVAPGDIDCHPSGPHATYLPNTAGNHVIRYNHITSDVDHYYNDALGALSNHSDRGFPHRDSDIYGNLIERVWDDAIEAEGGNANVRIWGNFIDGAHASIAVAPTERGPIYIWRNLSGHSIRYPPEIGPPSATGNRGPFLKNGSREHQGLWGEGRIYVFHNSILQPDGQGAMGISGSGGSTQNMVTRNNILDTFGTFASINDQPDPGIPNVNNDFDHDLFSGRVCLFTPAICCWADCQVACTADWGTENVVEPHGHCGEPTYRTENGVGEYYLEPGTPGHREGTLIPQFNCREDCDRPCIPDTDDCPDLGAHDSRQPPMRFGIEADPNPNQPPEITSATASPPQGPASLTVTFEATATDPDGQVLWYQWDFGNDDLVVAQTEERTFDAEASYAITLRVADDDGAVVETQIGVTVGDVVDAGSPDGAVTDAVGWEMSRVDGGSDLGSEDATILDLVAHRDAGSADRSAVDQSGQDVVVPGPDMIAVVDAGPATETPDCGCRARTDERGSAGRLTLLLFGAVLWFRRARSR